MIAPIIIRMAVGFIYYQKGSKVFIFNRTSGWQVCKIGNPGTVFWTYGRSNGDYLRMSDKKKIT